MNAMQCLSQRLESERLKLQMGLSPDVEVDVLDLRAMWQRLCRERHQAALARALGRHSASARRP